MITDLTRMSGGHVCVAGYTHDGQGIRLAAPRLYEMDIAAGGQPIAFPAAVVACDLLDHLPDPPHTEDYSFDPYSLLLVRRLQGAAWQTALDRLLFDGILLDLGVSSHQLDDASRGFTFREGAPLDMRMGDDAAMDAATWLATSEVPALAQAFREWADEPKAMRLARVIEKRRANAPLLVSNDLVGAIREALGARSGPGDFARLFQAVRIAVNGELTALERALPALRDRLGPGGVMAVIAYHSGEDRLVKHAFRAWSEECTCPPRQLHCTCGGQNALGDVVTKRAVTASEAEGRRNPRARSARLRVWRSRG